MYHYSICHSDCVLACTTFDIGMYNAIVTVPCMYMFVFFNNGMYWVCQLTYNSTVHSLNVHASGTDMYVHVYARWSGFQMTAHPDSDASVTVRRLFVC
jgi:hypothetical protein